MKMFHWLTVSLGAWLISQVGAQAQLPTAGQIGLNAALIKLFGEHTAFTAKTEVRMLDQARKETLSLTMDFSMNNQWMRADVDMAKIKSQDLPPLVLGQLKQMGVDQVASVMRPDKRVTYVIYPVLKAYTEVPMAPGDAADFQKKFDISKSNLGKETVAGHPCQKTKVVVLGDKGQRQEATVWFATDLKDFPVQMQMDQKDSSVVMTYRDIRLTPPDPKRFEAPAGLTKYASTEQLMQSAMLRMMGGK